jgi:hypothetical protein
MLKTASVYQTHLTNNTKLDDPIVRIALKWADGTNAPMFTLSTVVEVDGKPTIKKQNVTNANAHTFGPSNSLTSGTAKIDSVCFSNMGASAPFVLSSVIIKPGKREVIAIEDNMSAEELKEFVGVPEDEASTAPAEADESKDAPATGSMANKIAVLKAAAAAAAAPPAPAADGDDPLPESAEGEGEELLED